jgi:hypothetical protein
MEKIFEKLALSRRQSAFSQSKPGTLRPTADQCVGRGLQGQKDRQNDTDSTE